MKKTQKRMLGFLSLVLVAAMTVFAALLPNPASAVDVTSVTDTISVTVLDDIPTISITSPASGSAVSSLDTPLTIKYYNMASYKLTIKHIREDGSEDEERTVAEEDTSSAPVDETFEATYGFREFGKEFGYGKYVLTLTGTGLDGSTVQDSIWFDYVAVTADVTMDDNTGTASVDLNYDENDSGLSDDERVAKVVIVINDENGNPVPGISPIVVEAPGKHVEIPFDEYGLPSGNYKITVQGYNANGDALHQMMSYWVRYDEILVPSTADTGGLFKNLNISQTDYLITGVGIFLVVGIGGIIFINKRSKSTSRRRK